MKRICKVCRSEIKGNAAFCKVCGSKIDNDIESREEDIKDAQEKVVHTSKEIISYILAFLAGLFMPALSIIFIFFFGIRYPKLIKPILYGIGVRFVIIVVEAVFANI